MAPNTPGKRARWLQLAPEVRLRREHFGGIACDGRTGTMVEVDRAAFLLLALIERSQALGDAGLAAQFADLPDVSASPVEVASTIDQLLALAIVAVVSPERPGGRGVTTPRRKANACRLSPDAWPPGPHLSAPETVHWAITYACHASCPDCYARRHSHWFPTEFSTTDALRVVDRLAKWGVLQLATGGGEPTLRADLPAIAERAREHGLIVHVTTGDMSALPRHLTTLSGSVRAMQIGVQSDRLLARPEEEVTTLADCVALSEDLGVSLGANLMLSRTEVAHFDRLLELLVRARVPRVTLLRYKPPAEVGRWQQQSPPPAMMRGLERRLSETVRRYPGIALRVDCALSFLQRHVPAVTARLAGIRGCVAADRIVALSPDGGIFPCSQLVHPRWRAGHILADDPDAVWARAPVMQRYRFFRQSQEFRETTCGGCPASAQCGGCRVFADDAWGADPGCPAVHAVDDEASRDGPGSYPEWLTSPA